VADVNDLQDPAELAGEIVRLQTVNSVFDRNATVVKPRAGERVRVLEHTFNVDWAEFQGMTRREFWDRYANEIVRRIVFQVKRMETQLGRKLEFKRFDLPAETLRRKVLSYDSNGIFIGMIAHRTNITIGVLTPDTVRTQDVVDITFRAVIGLKEQEPGQD